MKKFGKAALVSVVLALATVVCALCIACSTNSNAVFKQKKEGMGGIVWTYTLTLEDGKATLAVTDADEKPIEAPLDTVAKALGKTGTYTFENNTYKVVLGDKTLTSTYDEATKTYTIPYSIVGNDTTISLELTYTK